LECLYLFFLARNRGCCGPRGDSGTGAIRSGRRRMRRGRPGGSRCRPACVHRRG
jgi:hypothetical protein